MTYCGACLFLPGCEPPRAAEVIAPLSAADLARDETLATRLIAACEEREQLSLLQPWLAAREAEGLVEDTETCAAVAGALERLAPKAKGLWGLLG